MSPRTILAPLAGLSVLLFLAQAEAASYRWVDEKGETVYSQTPPPQGVQATEIKPPPPPPEPVAGPETAAPEAKEPPKEKATKEGKKGKENKKEAELRQKNCDSAIKNLETLNNSQFKSVRAPDGTNKALDDTTRETMRKEAEQNIKEYCGKEKK